MSSRAIYSIFQIQHIGLARVMSLADLLKFFGIRLSQTEVLVVSQDPIVSERSRSFYVYLFESGEPTGIAGKSYNFVLNRGGKPVVLDRGKCFNVKRFETLRCYIEGWSPITGAYCFVCDPYPKEFVPVASI